MMAESSEEASHFEQVLGRLDALIKRNQPTEAFPVYPAPPAERDTRRIPVLTEIYQAEPSTAASPQSGEVAAQLLTEIAPLPVHTLERIPAPAPEPHVHNLDHGDEPLQPATINHGELVEKALASLLPLLQNRISQIFREEAEQALSQIQTGLEERLRGEIRAALEGELGALLKHSQPE